MMPEPQREIRCEEVLCEVRRNHPVPFGYGKALLIASSDSHSSLLSVSTENGPHDFAVVKGILHALNLLVVLVTLAGDHYQIALPRLLHCPPYRLAAVRFNHHRR